MGVAKNSFQEQAFLQWTQLHGVEVELTETTGPEDESLPLLGTQYDAFVTMDVYGDPETAVPVFKVGSSDFYFAVSKSRPDLLIELDAAMNRIQDENKYYNQQLHEKYLRNANNDRYLSAREQEWLKGHGTIRVGYQDNYLAFCASDPADGELTGALKDYLTYASTCLENARLDFEAVCFPTAAAAMEAMAKGEVDCVFQHSPVFRIGGDEFAVVLQNGDFEDREALVRRFDEEKETLCAEAENRWEEVHVAMGVAEHDPSLDHSVIDTVRRADKIMYADKREKKRKA